MNLHAGARSLDRVRARVLRPLFALRPLRRIYFERAERLGFQHALFAACALLFALNFPLWQLLLGPAVFGYAHLLSSVRHVPAAVARGTRRPRISTRALALLLGACAGHILYRFIQAAGWLQQGPANQSEWQGLGTLDVLFVASLCLGFAPLARRRASQWIGALLLLPLLIAMLSAPLETAGLLILLHNLIAYAYWLAFAPTGKARLHALVALATILIVGGLVLVGALDGLLPEAHGSEFLTSIGLNLQDLGLSILPASSDPMLWTRLVVAFAFGQSCHYFVWLKAIPESRQSKRVPRTVRSCLRTLELEFTRDGAHVLVYALGASFLLWLFLAVPEVRRFYFLFAGFHGLLELAGLPHLLACSAPRRATASQVQ